MSSTISSNIPALPISAKTETAGGGSPPNG